jgi:DNA repair exonuclease SbcCD ATPase subunit
MQIKRVTLQNWRSHKDTKLDFSKGTNMLVGIMGSGKSSVLEAICFALYGTFPALARKRVKLGQIATEGTIGADCRAEVVFEKDAKVKWKCRNCGYVHEGKDAPSVCPACKHVRSYYELWVENY